jgi:hypothetical protein
VHARNYKPYFGVFCKSRTTATSLNAGSSNRGRSKTVALLGMLGFFFFEQVESGVETLTIKATIVIYEADQ